MVRFNFNKTMAENTEIANRFHAEQVDAVLRLTPLMMVFHLVVGAFLVSSFYGQASNALLASWASVLFLVVCSNMDAWKRNRKSKKNKNTNLLTQVHTATINATALSLTWGIAMIALFPAADFKQQMALAFIVISMMSIGAFTLATVRQAALSYVVVFTICSVCALLMTRDSFFLALSGIQGMWALAIIVAVIHHSFLFAERVVTRSVIARQDIKIDFLEKDMSETLALAQFETDGDGVLKNVDRQFAALHGSSVAELTGVPLTEVFADEPRLHNFKDFIFGDDLDMLLEADAPFGPKIVAIAGKKQRFYCYINARTTVLSSGGYGKKGYLQDVSDIVEAILVSSEDPTIDSVTGLQNRQIFERKVLNFLSRNLAEKQPFLCMSLCVHEETSAMERDNKSRNEQVLRAVARRLERALNGHGVVCALAPNMFGILSPVHEVHHAPERLISGFAALLQQTIKVAGKDVSLAIRLGGAIAPLQGNTVTAIMDTSINQLEQVRPDHEQRWSLAKLEVLTKQVG